MAFRLVFVFMAFRLVFSPFQPKNATGLNIYVGYGGFDFNARKTSDLACHRRDPLVTALYAYADKKYIILIIGNSHSADDKIRVFRQCGIDRAGNLSVALDYYSDYSEFHITPLLSKNKSPAEKTEKNDQTRRLCLIVLLSGRVPPRLDWDLISIFIIQHPRAFVNVFLYNNRSTRLYNSRRR